MKRMLAAAGALMLAGCFAFPAVAQNQTPKTSPISLRDGELPYTVALKRVDTGHALPTLQSFAVGTYKGLWVLIGGRTNGLHSFSDDPLKNFPPSAQNRHIWVIDPATWKSWSRPLSDSDLSETAQDSLATTAAASTQVGGTLYYVGGYGYSRTQQNFVTFPRLASIDLEAVVAWARKEDGAKALSRSIRQTGNEALRVTGGQLAILNGRAVLAFGQSFTGGYGGLNRQVYTGQVRSFDIFDRYGRVPEIAYLEARPEKPNYNAYRRRDYNLLPILVPGGGGKLVEAAVAQAGVFTFGDGVWTVPVEINQKGRPSMQDPGEPGVFRQGMNSYNCASFTMYDSNTGANHMLQFGGISYISYSESKGFVADKDIPFINNSTAVVRKENGSYRQVLLGDAAFPVVRDKSGARLLFGAEAGVFLNFETPTLGNGIVDLRAVLESGKGEAQTIGYIFGGIAADAPNFGHSTASNEVFAIRVGPRS